MINFLFFTVRQSGLFLSILTYGLLLAAACTPSSGAPASQGTEIVIFIDFSGSIRGENRTLFEQDLKNKIIPSLTAGDRIQIAPITDRTLTEFNPIVEVTLPPRPEFNGWLDNQLKYKKQVEAIDTQVAQMKETVREQVSKIQSMHSSPFTDIFSALLIAQKLFHDAQRRKVLVLMSDMVEDYPPYHFGQIRWSPDTTEQLLTELDGKGLIPDLSGVCVYVTGASARSAELTENISYFWQAYFRRAKADMHPSRYAHVLLHWSPSKSCSFTPSSQRW